ncbi:uncharacterized protein LOC143180123 [Calliopsis andreniformis]|uniref:uncharacterized protein LOC143180123 n=1 Tax=Calliopsis andreniformis TaxID=337506 RepID=UPI003FCE849C
MDNNLQELKPNEPVQDDFSNEHKIMESYLLLKQKICETHEVIKQYNDKLKECERLKADLDIANKQIKKVTCNYNSTLAKVIKLEMQNTEYKKNIETVTIEVNDYKVKAAADQQHIQQLICKIKDVENQQNDKIMQYDLEKSSLQVKVKELEQELKNIKKSYDMKIKKMEKKIPTENSNSNKVKMKDIAINTVTPNEVKVKKPEVKEICIMTDEFYNTKNNMYPIFCDKCEDLLEPAPLEKICKIMTNSCPQLIDKISSPPKKPPPLFPGSSVINNEECKTENPPRLLEAPIPLLEIRENHTDFIPANILSPHTPISLNRTDYCNSFHQTPSLMNQSAYYIGSTPVNPLSLTNSTVANQNNSCEDMGAVASSLSIISSLQKRIDSLELKMKKRNKRESEQNSNCWQHMRTNPCCMYDINNSVQFNFMEMWKRMTDSYDKKDHRRMDVNKCRDVHSKRKLSRLKLKKRLQNASKCSWKVEPVAMKPEQSLRKKSRKRKHRHIVLLNKSDAEDLDNPEDLDKSVSDSDTNLYDDVFNDTVVNVNVSTASRKSKSHARTSNSLQTLKHSSQSSDIDEAEVDETIQILAEACKSAGGETDSGILSDSVESNKLGPVESKNVTTMKSSMRDSIVNESKLRISESTEKSTKLGRNNRLKASINSDILQLDDQIETAEDENESFQLNDSVPLTTKRKYSRKRKLSETQEVKKVCNRGGLLKKLKNLKKNSKTVKPCQSISDHQEAHNIENSSVSVSQEKKHLGNDTIVSNEDDYIPKKRPRIAHVPKSTVVEQKTTLKDLQKRIKIARSIASKTNSSSIPVNNVEANANIVEERKVVQRNSVDANRSSLVVQEIGKDINKELQNKCNNWVAKTKLNCLSISNPKAIDVTESSNTDTVSSEGSKQLPKETLPGTPLKSDVNDLPEEAIKLNNIKTDLSSQCENLKQEIEVNSVDPIKVITETSNSTNKNMSEPLANKDSTVDQSTNHRNESLCQLEVQPSHNENNSSGSISISEIDFDISDTCMQDIIKNEQLHNYKSSLNPEESLDDSQKCDEKVADLDVKEETVNSINQSCNPLAKLQQYITPNKCLSKSYKNQYKKLLHVRLMTDKFVKTQLQRLVDSEWEASVHWDVIEKLKSAACPPRIIAKGIVDFLSTKQECNVTLDKTYTPPAPLMTKAQQRIAALLVDLQDPMTFRFTQTGIEYKLFRLNQSLERSVIESLARMFTVLARIKKDREKVRIFCCDALYCLGLNAVIVLYTVFICWPEVFPNNETNRELLPKCMGHFITSQQATDYPKLYALKNLVSVFYKYPMGTSSKDLLNELLIALQEKSCNKVETAIILLAKREGTTWTYKNIIRGAILPMIINNKLPSTYRAFSLLGNLMRVFPTEDKDNSVGEIVEQLCDLINSGEGSDEQQEGVISALLSLSRHRFDEVVQNVIKWKPKGPLQDRTSEQLNGLFNLRTIEFWKGYLRKHKLIPNFSKQTKT